MREFNKTQLKGVQSYEAESLERKIESLTTANSQIEETAPLIYQEEQVGIMPAYDIRTDRFETAQEAMDKVTKSIVAKRDEKPETEENKQE